jgi:hypothetical protein
MLLCKESQKRQANSIRFGGMSMIKTGHLTTQAISPNPLKTELRRSVEHRVNLDIIAKLAPDPD